MKDLTKELELQLSQENSTEANSLESARDNDSAENPFWG